jgi:hypothetical protein
MTPSEKPESRGALPSRPKPPLNLGYTCHNSTQVEPNSRREKSSSDSVASPAKAPQIARNKRFRGTSRGRKLHGHKAAQARWLDRAERWAHAWQPVLRARRGRYPRGRGVGQRQRQRQQQQTRQTRRPRCSARICACFAVVWWPMRDG